MQLIILGTKIGTAVQKVIANQVDNVKITIFSSMNEFADAAEMRNVPCDRVIFTEEVIIGANATEKKQHLQAFKSFLDGRYMNVTTVALLKEQDTLSICDDVFFEDGSINICISGKVKPACLIALAHESTEGIAAMFPSAQPEQAPAPVPTPATNSVEPSTPVPQKKPEKKSLFGGFGKKKQKDAEPQINASEFMSDFANAPVEKPQESVSTATVGKRRKPAGFGGTSNAPVQETPASNDFDDFGASNNTDFDDFGASGNTDFDDFGATGFESPASDEFGDFESPASGGLGDFEPSVDDGFGTEPEVNNAFDDFGAEPISDSAFDDFGDTQSDGFGDFEAPQQPVDNFADFGDMEQASDGFDDFSAPEQASGGFDDFDVPEQTSNDFGGFDTPEQPVDNFSDFDVPEQPNNVIDDFEPAFEGTPDAVEFEDSQFFGLDEEPQKEIPTNTYFEPPKRKEPKQLQSVDADTDVNLSAIDAYENAKQPVKVVEKEVIREVVREVRVPASTNGAMATGGVSKFENIKRGNLSAVIVVTGDRRSGVTSTAMTFASIFSKYVPTLFVDLDTKYHGALYFLGAEDLMDSETAVQNGLGLIKSGKDIKRYVFRSTKYKFDSLTTLPGGSVSEDDIRESVGQLAFQGKFYKAIIVDCPIENLHLCEELMYSADFFICTDSDLCACSNLLFRLDSVQIENAPSGKGVHDKALAIMYNKAQYIVKVTEEKNDVVNNMRYLEQVYDLDEEKFNLARLRYAGTMDSLDNILMNMQ